MTKIGQSMSTRAVSRKHVPRFSAFQMVFFAGTEGLLIYQTSEIPNAERRMFYNML